MENDLKYWLALNRITSVGAVRLKKIYSYFSSMQLAWQASFNEFKQAGLEESVITRILAERKEIEPDRELEKILNENIQAVTLADNNYPRLLKEIYAAPALLYYKGQLKNAGDDFSIAIVGTRKFSSYGRQVTEELSSQLAQQNVTIVSGLALGVDALAHQTALKNKGRTIAVLGSGLDKQNIYPSANRYLADQILAQNGLIVSEYPIGTLPLQGHFPQRNRIIAGLSSATLVIEAPEKSGALLTAKYALEANREVLAVPGNIYSLNSFGTNNLIKLGAKLITQTADILEALNMEEVKSLIQNKKIVADSKEEEIILKYLSKEPQHINEIIKYSQLSTAAVNSTLILMEMKGKIKNLGGQMYVLAR